MHLKTNIKTFSSHHPRANFGETASNVEEIFINLFLKTYEKNYPKLHRKSKLAKHAYELELPVSGHGIPDLITLSWKSNLDLNLETENLRCPNTVLRSFEFKIRNWKKGLMQAYRYGLYTDASILVLPNERIRSVSRHLDTFKKLNVGLWAFDSEKFLISKIFTPRPKTPTNLKIRKFVYKKFLTSFKFPPAA